MKKIISKIMILVLLMTPTLVNAAPSGSTSCSSSGSVSLNNTITVTVTGKSSDVMWDTVMSYDSSKLQYISGSGERNISDTFYSTITYTYKFKAIAEGTAYVKTNSTVSDYNGDKNYFSSSCNINVSKSSSSNSGNNNSGSKVTKSSDNNLKSLSIDNYSLDPEFNKDTLEYNVKLESDITKIKVNAEANDSKSTVTGAGEIEVKEGQNKIEIVVTAENGSTKTYILNAVVKEKDPINVKVAGKEYTIVRKLDNVDMPTGFEKVNIEISDDEVEAYYNKKIDYTLVALQDSKGGISLYIYDKQKFTYTKYLSIASKELNIVVIKLENEDIIPYKYYKTKLNYNNEEIEVYTLDDDSNFRLIYAMDIETGKKSLYSYDINENTIQKFNSEQSDIYTNLINKLKLVFIVLGAFIFILLIIIIVLLSKNVKFKTKYLNSKLNPIDNPGYSEKK